MATKTEGIRIILKDKETDKPLGGIPVNIKVSANNFEKTKKTDDKWGEATFETKEGFDTGETITIIVNPGAYFGYEEVRPGSSAALPGLVVIRRYSLAPKGEEEEEPEEDKRVEARIKRLKRTHSKRRPGEEQTISFGLQNRGDKSHKFYISAAVSSPQQAVHTSDKEFVRQDYTDQVSMPVKIPPDMPPGRKTITVSVFEDKEHKIEKDTKTTTFTVQGEPTTAPKTFCEYVNKAYKKVTLIYMQMAVGDWMAGKITTKLRDKAVTGFQNSTVFEECTAEKWAIITELKVNKTEVAPGERPLVRFTVKNTGKQKTDILFRWGLETPSTSWRIDDVVPNTHRGGTFQPPAKTQEGEYRIKCETKIDGTKTHEASVSYEVKEEKKQVGAEISDLQMVLPRDEYLTGETLHAALKIKNTEKTEHTFAVGMSLISISPPEDAPWKKVQVNAGQRKETDLVLDAPHRATTGEHTLKVSVWGEWEGDKLINRLDSGTISIRINKKEEEQETTTWQENWPKSTLSAQTEFYKWFTQHADIPDRSLFETSRDKLAESAKLRQGIWMDPIEPKTIADYGWNVWEMLVGPWHRRITGREVNGQIAVHRPDDDAYIALDLALSGPTGTTLNLAIKKFITMFGIDRAFAVLGAKFSRLFEVLPTLGNKGQADLSRLLSSGDEPAVISFMKEQTRKLPNVSESILHDVADRISGSADALIDLGFSSSSKAIQRIKGEGDTVPALLRAVREKNYDAITSYFDNITRTHTTAANALLERKEYSQAVSSAIESWKAIDNWQRFAEGISKEEFERVPRETWKRVTEHRAEMEHTAHINLRVFEESFSSLSVPYQNIVKRTLTEEFGEEPLFIPSKYTFARNEASKIKASLVEKGFPTEIIDDIVEGTIPLPKEADKIAVEAADTLAKKRALFPRFINWMFERVPKREKKDTPRAFKVLGYVAAWTGTGVFFYWAAKESINDKALFPLSDFYRKRDKEGARRFAPWARAALLAYRDMLPIFTLLNPLAYWLGKWDTDLSIASFNEIAEWAGFDPIDVDEKEEEEKEQLPVQEEFQAMVRSVSDGDTVRIAWFEESEEMITDKLRLVGINSPELANTKRQDDGSTISYPAEPFAKESTQWLSKKINNRDVTIKTDPTRARDSTDEKRILGAIYLQDEYINLESVKKGWSSYYPLTPNKHVNDQEFREAQAAAMAAKIGMWSGGYAKLRVKSSPGNAQIFINGDDMEVQTTGTFDLAPGTYEVTVKKDDHLDATKSITLEPSDDKSLFLELSEVTDTAEIYLASVPSGARIFMEGKETDLLTPETLKIKKKDLGDSDSGNISLKLKRNEYKDWERSVFIKLGDSKRLEITLESEKENVGQVKVTTNPANAAIYVDGKNTGTLTPHTIELQCDEEHEIAVKAKGFAEFTFDSIWVPCSKLKELYHKFEEKVTTGKLRVVSTPTYATIEIDGEDNGFTPKTFDVLEGTWTVTLKKRGYMDYTFRNVVIEKGHQKDIYAEMSKEEETTGTLSIISAPSLAGILIKDSEGIEKTAGYTPQTVSKLKPGTYMITLSKKGYADTSSSATVKQGETTEVFIDIEKIETNSGLNIRSSPTNAKIFINGEDSGYITPKKIDLTEGQYNLKIELDKFRPFTARPIVVRNKYKDMFARLEPFEEEIGTVKVSSSPSTSYIKVNGQDIFRVTSSTIKLDPGAYIVSVSKRNYQEQERDIIVLKGKHLDVHFDLSKKEEEKNQGELSIRSSPSNAIIKIAGDTIGKLTPETIDLDPGTYEVEVEKDGYESKSTTIEIILGELTEVFLQLDGTEGAEEEEKRKKAEEEEAAKVHGVPEGWPWTLAGTGESQSEAGGMSSLFKGGEEEEDEDDTKDP